MKTAKLGMFLVSFVLGFSLSSEASYLTIPGNTGVPDEGSNNCTLSYEYMASDGAACYLYYPISIPAGSTLSSVTVYYYDTSVQNFTAYLKAVPLSSTGSTTLASVTDTSTSASVQYSTLSYGSATSSSYAYSLYVALHTGTQFRGFKVYYY